MKKMLGCLLAVIALSAPAAYATETLDEQELDSVNAGAVWMFNYSPVGVYQGAVANPMQVSMGNGGWGLGYAPTGQYLVNGAINFAGVNSTTTQQH